jgi:hypothetical protein
MPGDLEAFGAVQREALVRFQQIEDERQDEIKQILADNQRSQDQKIEDLETVQADAKQKIEDLVDQTGMSAEAIVDSIRERTTAILQASKSSPITGNPLLDLLLAGILGGASVPAASGAARRFRQQPLPPST